MTSFFRARSFSSTAIAITLASGLALRFATAVHAEAAPSAPVGAPAQDVADMDITELVKVRVSPFDVSSGLDRGYLASNSVSGSRFDTPIRDLPFPIQAFTESFIKDQKPVNIFDVARYSPGVTYRSNDFNEGNANLAIRGFAVSSTPGNPQILRDGFHGPSILDLTNIARVEVVKGPASFLYGEVAPGGIVNVITKTPQAQFAATADATFGSYGEYRYEADVTGPASNTLLFRVAASDVRDIHYWEAYDAHSWDIAPSLLWLASDRVRVSLKYELFRKIESPQVMQEPAYNTQSGIVPTSTDPDRAGVSVPGLPDNWNSMSYEDFRHSRTDALSTWVDFKADDHWNLRTSYSHQAYQIDELATGNFGMANNTTFLQGRRVRRQIYTNRDDTIEAQGTGKYAFDHLSLRLLVGAQYVARSFDNQAGQAPNNPALGSNPTASPLPLWNLADPATWNRATAIPFSALTASPANRTTDYEDTSVYAGTTFGLLDERLLVLAGWRLTSTENQLTDRVTKRPQTRLSASAVTPQYAVLYKLTSGLSAYASYTESFVPATQLLNSPDGTTTPADPTKGQGRDVGLKADLLNGRVSGTLSFFDIRNRNVVNDLSLLNPATGVQIIYNVQAGEERSRGIEFDTTLTLTENWQAYLSYSYIDARISEFSGHDAAILAEDPSALNAAGRANYKNVLLFHDAPLQMSAPQLANLWTRYRFKGAGLGGAYIGGGANLVVDQTLLPNGPPSSRQTYTLFNALVGYSWPSWGRRGVSVELMGKNLNDEHYRPSQSTRGRPREFLLTLEAGF